MEWNLDPSRPIYQQIIEKVETEIASGRYQPGQQLPSVRELALEAGVNPNTMQRALSELERGGLVTSRRTSGRFITEDGNMIGETRNAIADRQIRIFLEKMADLGMTKKELLKRMEKEAVSADAQNAAGQNTAVKGEEQ
ncbi:MAG: GntR family transcriptional regulator [Lachnospiraceae bacterium]|jgi:GntR family transcriptional regulator|nr:GntR family transcriptional regulator [Lachnospiraceae bacterium]MCI1727150.1 GntR family transcriptional regulator [Lachnospiraceae bacterium]